MQVHYFDLNSTLGRTTYRSAQIRVQEAHKYCITGYPDEIRDPVFFAIFVDLRIGKGSVTPKPEKLEPTPAALHYGLNALQSAIGRMDVTRKMLNKQLVCALLD
jgi:hypothetical protein